VYPFIRARTNAACQLLVGTSPTGRDPAARPSGSASHSLAPLILEQAFVSHQVAAANYDQIPAHLAERPFWHRQDSHRRSTRKAPPRRFALRPGTRRRDAPADRRRLRSRSGLSGPGRVAGACTRNSAPVTRLIPLYPCDAADRLAP